MNYANDLGQCLAESLLSKYLLYSMPQLKANECVCMKDVSKRFGKSPPL